MVAVAAHVVIVIVLLAGWAACEAHQGHRSSASARRPASVILTRATSIARPPATTRSLRVVATGADEINQEIDREPVREHDRLAAAVGGCGEQFERAAALGLWAAPAA